MTCELKGNTVVGTSDQYHSVMTALDSGNLQEAVTVKGNTLTVTYKKE